MLRAKESVARLAASAALVLPCVALADVYRCVGADGRTTYSDSPCPRGSSASNITERVHTCATPECAEQLEKERAAARARLAEDKAAVKQMQEERRKAEAEDLERRIKLEALRRQAALDLTRQEAVTGVYAPAYPYPVWPVYPGYGSLGRWDGAGCRDLLCGPVPRPVPGEDARRERGLSFIDPPSANKPPSAAKPPATKR